MADRMRWDGSLPSLRTVARWAGHSDGGGIGEPRIDWVTVDGLHPEDVLLHELEGEVELVPGDWVVKDADGECRVAVRGGGGG